MKEDFNMVLGSKWVWLKAEMSWTLIFEDDWFFIIIFSVVGFNSG